MFISRIETFRIGIHIINIDVFYLAWKRNFDYDLGLLAPFLN